MRIPEWLYKFDLNSLQREIMAVILQRQGVPVDVDPLKLARHLNVTESTIKANLTTLMKRRYITKLSNEGRVLRLEALVKSLGDYYKG